ncbi:hypothetical protein HDU98_007998 [Podochytrium sp. JEL0797]|nr:hypothetical protein HDU98_007998 [Podochytrium sp. JEL0797]
MSDISDDENLALDLFGGDVSDDESLLGDASHGQAQPGSHEEEEQGQMGYADEEEEGLPGSHEDTNHYTTHANEDNLDSDDLDDRRPASPTPPPEEDHIIAQLALNKRAPPAQLATDSYLAKVPHFLAFHPLPYDKAAFAKTLTPEILANEERKLRLENTIRWRYNSQQTMAKDSNARIVRWSDGSFSLLLHNEIFDCHVKRSSEKSHHYLASLHNNEEVLQNHMRIDKNVMFVSSKSGETHKRMMAAIAKKHQKERGVKLFTDTKFDPVVARKEAEKREREANQAAKKMQAERHKTANSYGGSGSGSGGGGSHAAAKEDRYSARRYDDYSDDEMDHHSRSRTTTNLDAYEEDFVEDDDVEEAASDSEDERRREEKLRAAKRARRDEGESSSKKSIAKRRVIDDSDDDE